MKHIAEWNGMRGVVLPNRVPAVRAEVQRLFTEREARDGIHRPVDAEPARSS